MITGLNIIVAPEIPLLQLSPTVPVSEEFRAEMNAWLLDFFGVNCIVKDGEAISLEGTLVVNRRTYMKLKEINTL